MQNTTSKRSGAYDEDKRKKVKHITKNLAVGTCTIQDGSSKRAVRNFHYSVGRFQNDVDEDKIKNFLSKKIGDQVTVEKLSLKHDHFRVFRISCCETNNALMIDPATWQ